MASVGAPYGAAQPVEAQPGAPGPLPVVEGPQNRQLVLDAREFTQAQSSLSGTRVDSALEFACAMERMAYLRLRGTLRAAQDEHRHLAARIDAYLADPDQQTWQALGARLRRWALKLGSAERRLAEAVPGTETDPGRKFDRLRRRMDPRDFVFQDVRTVLADVPADEFGRLRNALNTASAKAFRLIGKLDPLRIRCGW